MQVMGCYSFFISFFFNLLLAGVLLTPVICLVTASHIYDFKLESKP